MEHFKTDKFQLECSKIERDSEEMLKKILSLKRKMIQFLRAKSWGLRTHMYTFAAIYIKPTPR